MSVFLRILSVVLLLSSGCFRIKAPAVDAGPGAPPTACGTEGKPCCGDGLCSASLSCRDAVCVAQSFKDIGHPCSQPSDCADGACLSLSSTQNVCTLFCGRDADCLSGWLCGTAPGADRKTCQCTPRPGRCNGVDDDCNGVVDDEAEVGSTCTAERGDGWTCVSGACGCAGTDCHGLCVDTATDLKNCGACGHYCPEGASCSAGTCHCPDGQRECGGACVDVQTSVSNCGACGNHCEYGAVCSAGQCGCPDGMLECNGRCVWNDKGNCGTCGNICPALSNCDGTSCSCFHAGESQCNQACVDLQTSNTNCGGCGERCTSPEVCSAGSCGCPGGGVVCGSTCFPSTITSCGSCDGRCASGGVCTAGACGCPEGRTACDSLCADTSTDVRNCGGCGVSCPQGGQCVGGQCLCPTGSLDCDGVCRDTRTDTANCGACGHTCNPGELCSQGSCVTNVCEAGESLCNAGCVDLSSDSENCGGCGVTCTATAPSTATCSAGRCVTTLAAGQVHPWAVSVIGNDIYWVNEGTTDYTGSLMKIPSTGGEASRVLQLNHPTFLKTHGRQMCWGSYTADDVWIYSLDDGFYYQSSVGPIDDIECWTDHLYVQKYSNILRMPVHGGSVATLQASSNGSSRTMSMSAWGELYVLRPGQIVSGQPALDGTFLVESTVKGSYSIRESHLNRPDVSTTDDQNLYWSDLVGGEWVLSGMPTGYSAEPTVIARLSTQPRVLAADGVNVYVIDAAQNILRVSVSGGATATLAHVADAAALAVDATSVYVVVESIALPSGSILKITPK